MNARVLKHLITLWVLYGIDAFAKPSGPDLFCATFNNSPLCQSGVVGCELCHSSVPTLNVFGTCVQSELAQTVGSPISSTDFDGSLDTVLLNLQDKDCDQDGFSNLEEILAGTFPGDSAQSPEPLPDGNTSPTTCEEKNTESDWDVCGIDLSYTYRKVLRDFCGRSPSFGEMEAFLANSDGEGALTLALDGCLDSHYWQGKNGVLWQIAHSKITPLAVVKSGPGAGAVPLANYDVDYSLFTWTQIDGHDARDVLLADYFVVLSPSGEYQRFDELPDEDVSQPGYAPSLFQKSLAGIATNQDIPKRRRAGMLTTQYYLFQNTMFTALPRTAAAQAFRAYLGIDIARSEGLNPASDPLVDYDAKGITNPDCAYCHTTLDPLSYPFKNYTGIEIAGQLGMIKSLTDLFKLNAPYTYKSTRIESGFANLAPDITSMPEAGVIFGKPVANLREWVAVATASDEFAQNIVNDYWQRLVGTDPATSPSEFANLWRDLKERHDYSVEAMLHDLIKTEVYGAP